ncbi:FAD binding domain-containing protein [Schizophyllum commune]
MATSVLIAGAGPTGLTLALALLKNGVTVRIIDKMPEPRVGQKGNGLQPRTLEVFNFLGVLDDVIAGSGTFKPVRVYKMPGGVEVAKEIHPTTLKDPLPDKPWPNARSMGQDRLEAILARHLEAQSCPVERGVELHSFTQSDDKVSVQLKKADGSVEHVDVEILVGCDGAHSAVRKGLGLSFLGETMEEDWMIVGDIYVKGLSSGYWHVWGGPGGAPGGVSGQDGLFFNLRTTDDPGLFAVVVGGPEARERSLDPLEKPLDTRDGLVEAFYKTTGRTDIEFGELKHASWWRPNIRMVDKFSEGRVFVAGDAAHTHSPAGGQGLNSSVQDGFNLAWKIALVHKKLAPPTLLTTYTAERLPVITTMLQKTTALFSKTLALFKHGAGAAADDAEKEWQRTRSEMEQFGVNYRGSGIALDERNPLADAMPSAYGPGDGVLRAGDRAPSAPVKCASDVGMQKLFDVLGCEKHTILVFTSKEETVQTVVDAVKSLPEGVADVIVVAPEGQDVGDVCAKILQDVDGQAAGIYQVDHEPTIVVIRPDGVIGAIVLEAKGIGRYFANILA